jgi:hypothetical protein
MLCHVDNIRTNILEEYCFFANMLWLLVTADVPSLPILVTLMMEVIYSSEISILTRTTQHIIPEDSILHSHYPPENLKSYKTSLLFNLSQVQNNCFISVLLHSRTDVIIVKLLHFMRKDFRWHGCPSAWLSYHEKMHSLQYKISVYFFLS